MQIYLNLHEMGYQRMHSLGTFYCPCNIINCVSITEIEVKNTRSWNEYIFVIVVLVDWMSRLTRLYFDTFMPYHRKYMNLLIYVYCISYSLTVIFLKYHIVKVKYCLILWMVASRHLYKVLMYLMWMMISSFDVWSCQYNVFLTLFPSIKGNVCALNECGNEMLLLFYVSRSWSVNSPFSIFILFSTLS